MSRTCPLSGVTPSTTWAWVTNSPDRSTQQAAPVRPAEPLSFTGDTSTSAVNLLALRTASRAAGLSSGPGGTTAGFGAGVAAGGESACRPGGDANSGSIVTVSGPAAGSSRLPQPVKRAESPTPQ